MSAFWYYSQKGQSCLKNFVCRLFEWLYVGNTLHLPCEDLKYILSVCYHALSDRTVDQDDLYWWAYEAFSYQILYQQWIPTIAECMMLDDDCTPQSLADLLPEFFGIIGGKDYREIEGSTILYFRNQELIKKLSGDFLKIPKSNGELFYLKQKKAYVYLAYAWTGEGLDTFPPNLFLKIYRSTV